MQIVESLTFFSRAAVATASEAMWLIADMAEVMDQTSDQ